VEPLLLLCHRHSRSGYVGAVAACTLVAWQAAAARAEPSNQMGRSPKGQSRSDGRQISRADSLRARLETSALGRPDMPPAVVVADERGRRSFAALPPRLGDDHGDGRPRCPSGHAVQRVPLGGARGLPIVRRRAGLGGATRTATYGKQALAVVVAHR
jgi:hypothetical protein